MTSSSRVEALLTIAADESEAMMLEEILGKEGIPVLLKHMGATAYFGSYAGTVEVYVPSTELERARELITLSPPTDAADNE